MTELSFPASALGERVPELARRARIARPPPVPSPRAVALGAVDGWFAAAASWLGVEVETVSLSVEELVANAHLYTPAVLAVPGEDAHRYVALLGSEGGQARVLAAGELVQVPWVRLARLAAGGAAAEAEASYAGALAAAGVSGPAAQGAVDALLEAALGRARFAACFVLRAPVAGRSFLRVLSESGVLRRLGSMLLLHLAAYGLQLASWVAIGRAALEGIVDRGWLQAWVLLLLTAVPVTLAASWLSAHVTYGASRALRRRLLRGALRLDPEELRHEGAGHLLGRVLEVESLEVSLLGGGLLALSAVLELLVLPFALGRAAGGPLLSLLLLGTVAVVVGVAVRAHALRRAWTDKRLALTHTLVERMVGHRTRLAQAHPAHWHDAEDAALARYLASSRRMDGFSGWAMALTQRGWPIVGMVALAPAFVRGTDDRVALAVGVGGVLLAGRSLVKLASGLMSLVDATLSWRVVGPLFRAAAAPVVAGVPALAAAVTAFPEDDAGEPLLRARDVAYGYGDHIGPVLRGATFALERGDRVLLEGPSGGGKSTLVSLLTGVRSPTRGTLLLRGFDRRTLGPEAWRRLVAAAPQFHENHVFTGTLAFNLLLGRAWPPREEDLAEAAEVCDELGLGPLLARMPGGLMQMVGESGWQLSHGERSRIFLARALLQKAQVVVLDESLAALDPENLQRALACAERRAPTLVVVAHP